MAYQCPKCGGAVSRGYSVGAQAVAGLVGALFYAAFGSFQCQKCGTIERSEFPQEVQEKMTIGSVTLGLTGVVVAVVVVILLTNMN